MAAFLYLSELVRQSPRRLRANALSWVASDDLVGHFQVWRSELKGDLYACKLVLRLDRPKRTEGLL